MGTMRSTSEKCFTVSPKPDSLCEGRNAALKCPKLHNLATCSPQKGWSRTHRRLMQSRSGTHPPMSVAYSAFWDLPLTIAGTYRGSRTSLPPLHHLTSKGVAFHWDSTCQSAFEQLKVELTKTPVLAFPDFSQAAAPFHLQIDATAVGIGAVLEQDGHGIAYASRVLFGAQLQHYPE